jgi:hypothetical protein
MDDDTDDAPSPRTEDDKRRAALAVMAGSIAPRDISWWFPSGGWKEPWRELARLPFRRRLTACGAFALIVTFSGFLTWAVVSGHGAAAAYALLGLLGMSVITLPVSLLAIAIARRKRRMSRGH